MSFWTEVVTPLVISDSGADIICAIARTEPTAHARSLLARAGYDGEEKHEMAHTIRPRPLATLFYLALSGPLLAAQPPITDSGNLPSKETGVDAASAAAPRTCVATI